MSQKHKYYYNRELSWINFNGRVLEEAFDEANPLLERLKFLAITAGNLDEFFMVRVASLKDQVMANYKKPDIAGLTPKKQLKKISQAVHSQVASQYKCWEELSRQLISHDLFFINCHQLSAEQEAFLSEYFTSHIYPVLTPMVVNQSRPFPFLSNKSLNICLLKTNYDPSTLTFALVQVPVLLNRVIELPCHKGRAFVLLEDVIIHYLHRLFQGHEIIAAAPFRITRNTDLPINEDGAEDLLQKIEEWLKIRQRGTTIRLEIAETVHKDIKEFLQASLAVHKGELYQITGPLDLSFLMNFYNQLTGYKQLRFPKFKPVLPTPFAATANVFDLIKAGDQLLHHPYHSFQPVIDFITAAASDPQVLAIKQTLYRVSGHSPIIKALAQAAGKGKQVTVVVEIKARFDEENNIQWARKLEEAGCHVIVGLAGLKVHSKMTLVVRNETDGIRRYLHLGTGNYNDITAQFYTDMGLFTCNELLAADVSSLFNMLTGYSKESDWRKLAVAPVGLRENLINLIDKEIELTTNGQQGHIVVKVNSLVDKPLIEKLYEASQAGVKIDLIVRGICSLIPGIPDVSHNIRVISIVGRLLEHTRIFYFYNGGYPTVFLSSADWMPRNMNNRIEVAFPIEDEAVKKQVVNSLFIMLQDNVKARVLHYGQGYKKPIIQDQEEQKINSQEILMEMAKTERNL